MGKTWEGNLCTYFLDSFGNRDSPAFKQVQQNFIASLAAYSVASYVLQVKDRHNGNILVDTSGHIIHIDFGFIFDISPGGNLKFERAPFKLSKEMIEVMGGGMDAPPFVYFSQCCVRGYLSLRKHMRVITGLVALMLECGLPCFKGATIEQLTARFVPDKSDEEAGQFMLDRVRESFSQIATTTQLYDQFQAWQNNIDY